MELKVKVSTKRNYRGLNGTWLTVHQVVGNRVSVIVSGVTCDFTIAEVSEWQYNYPYSGASIASPERKAVAFP